MIRRWLVRHREAAAAYYFEQAGLARLLSGAPIGLHADHFKAKALRRLRRWDRALDLYTRNGTR